MAYLADGRLEMTNGRAEQGIRKFLMGKKAWLYCDQGEGSEASEVIYSIVETALANDLHPYEYLKFLLETLSQQPSTPETLGAVMPWSDRLPDHVRGACRQKISLKQENQERS